jgi:hypothetical protein
VIGSGQPPQVTTPTSNGSQADCLPPKRKDCPQEDSYKKPEPTRTRTRRRPAAHPQQDRQQDPTVKTEAVAIDPTGSINTSNNREPLTRSSATIDEEATGLSSARSGSSAGRFKPTQGTGAPEAPERTRVPTSRNARGGQDALILNKETVNKIRQSAFHKRIVPNDDPNALHTRPEIQQLGIPEHERGGHMLILRSGSPKARFEHAQATGSTTGAAPTRRPSTTRQPNPESQM